eukprot:10529238-Alexandrium_andersonii.AAC.1
MCIRDRHGAGPSAACWMLQPTSFMTRPKKMLTRAPIQKPCAWEKERRLHARPRAQTLAPMHTHAHAHT